MPKQMTAEQKLTYMTETPLPRLVLSLSVPTIVSMLITSFYNMADTYFVGLIGSASASGRRGRGLPADGPSCGGGLHCLGMARQPYGACAGCGRRGSRAQ